MKKIIVTGLDDSAVERLEKRAAAHGRSLEEEVRHILTCGLDALEYTQTVFTSLKEKAAKVSAAASSLDTTLLRARVEQMLNEARDRDAKLLEELERDLGS